MAKKTPPKYDIAILETLILEMAAELHPERLSTPEFTWKIVGDPDDRKEVGAVRRAIRNLREFGLVHRRDDEIVELTQPALRAVTLLR